MLAVLGQSSDRLRLLAFDGIAVFLRRLGRSTVVDLIDDQQVEEAGEPGLAGEDLVEHALDARGPQPLKADDRPRVDGEGVGFKAVGPPELPELVCVENLEAEAELGFHFLLPLERERGRADDDDASCPVAEQHLLDDEASLDGLAEAHVVGDEQVDARHRESAGYGLELVLLDGDAAAERSLERLGVGAGDGAPADGVEERTEGLRIVPAGFGDLRELSGGDDLAAWLDFPDDGQFLTEVIVADAGKGDESPAGKPCRGDFVGGLVAVVDVADHPLLAPHPHELPGLRHVRIARRLCRVRNLGGNSRHRPPSPRRRFRALRLRNARLAAGHAHRRFLAQTGVTHASEPL